MGVPRLYKWLRETYPTDVYQRSVGKKITWNDLPRINEGKQADNFFIDGVSILHQCAARVFKYGDHKIRENEENEYENLDENQKTILAYQFAIEYILEMVRNVNPKYLIYISFDGVAPMAKQGQQRQRRFIAAKSREESCTTFDSNKITAGSSFTYNFCLYVKYTLIERLSSDPFFNSNTEIIFSSSNVPGEGEHKIMDYLRENNCKNKRNVLYGPDGDLIMLALCTHLKDFWILRENFFDMSKFDIVNIGSIYKKIVNNLSEDISVPCNSQDIIHDFILMGFFLGNDFLPKLQMVDMLEKGLETFLSRYKNIKKEKSVTYEWNLTKNKNIEFNNFQHFINVLSGLEKHFLISQTNNKNNKEKYINHTLFNACHKNEHERMIFDYFLYDELYTALKLDGDSNMTVDKYFEGLQWVFQYYVNGCPDWKWIYSFHHAPLMKHMSSPVNKTRFKKMIFQKNKASLPFRQMMCVIPPLSASILHKKLQFVYAHPKLEKYYPHQFEMDFEGKKQEWQGVAILPFIDQSEMDEVYDTTKDNFKNCKENSVTKNILLKFDKDSILEYTSKYGKLEDVPVFITELE